MDNVTHVLAGLLVAEALVTVAAPRGTTPSVAYRRRAWFVSALTNNLPDFDFVYTGITQGRIGYLLHHRGHTHTLLVGFLLGLATFLASDALARRRLKKLAPGAPEADPRVVRTERLVTLLLAMAGPAIHIGMDFFNNYGVHPFWPVANDWVYGDSIFILEPWFLVFAVPPLFFGSRTLVSKVLLCLCLAAFLGLAWAFPLVNIATALALTLVAGLWFFWCSRARSRAVQSLLASLVVLFTFVLAGRVARARVLDAAASSGVTKLDAVLTPAPSNPLCWNAISVGARGADYELRVATLSLLPGLVPPESCRFGPSGGSLPPDTPRYAARAGEAPPRSGLGNGGPGLRWELAWTAPLAELRTLARTNCDAAAFLRYSRAPYFFTRVPGRIYLGDLRYDREPEEEFAEWEIPATPDDCPRFVPPWRPPRHELLETP